MNLKFRIKNILLSAVLGCFCLWTTLPSGAQTGAAITVNAASTITSFVPIHIFGNNLAYWVNATTNEAVAAQVEAAGNYFLRYPGGSSSDDFHWNGQGTWAANAEGTLGATSGYWVPGATYSAGFQACQVFRGTTSTSYAYPSNIDDGNTATTWMSNADTDFPDSQWVYMDLGATNTSASAVSIIWGNPYATSFEVQYYNGNTTPYSSTTALWTNTSAGTVAGTGGTQVVTFTAVDTRFVRILMTASSNTATPAYAIAELYVLNGTNIVSKNADTEAAQSPVVVSSTDPSASKTCTTDNPDEPLSPNEYATTFDFNTYMTEVNSFSPKAIPLITVNVGSGTAAEAASWVYYANITKGYGIQYWQIGNETNGNWETGGPMNADDYGRRFIEYYNAMEAANTGSGVSLIIVGPVSGSPNASSNLVDGNSYIYDFLQRLVNNPGGSAITDLGGLDFHWYPGVTAYPAGFSTAAQLANFPTTLTGWAKAAGVTLGIAGVPTGIPVLMSEYNCNANAYGSNATVQEANGLWLAAWLGAFINGFGGNGFANLWDVIDGGSDSTVATDGDLGYLNNTSPYQAHATYWAMQMMATDWAKQGDSSANELVTTTSSAATLVSYADYRPDGVLSLMVVNEDSTNSYATTLNIGPFVPGPTANSWTFNTNNYAWQTTMEPYNANPDSAPTSTLISGVSSSFPVTFSPSSINILQFTNSNLPTSTPTSSFTATATKTASNTPTATLTGTSTFSPTNSPTATLTGTFTLTPTVTFTGTSTDSPTASNTFTLTSTPTNSATPTLTQTPTSTPTVTPTNTICMDAFGNTCTLSPTPPATATPTATFTDSPTWTATVTSTSTLTFTPTDSFTSTASLTATSSPTVTLSFTPTQSPTPTSTPALTGLFPNPYMGTGSLKLSYQVTGSADQVEVKVFTLAFRKIFEDDNLSASPGGHLYTFFWGLNNLDTANGLYYVVLIVKTGGSETHRVMKLLVIQ